MSSVQARDHHLYFIYGSNLLPGQMAARCGKPEALAIARLAGHRLAFFGHSAMWDSGEATVIRQPGEGYLVRIVAGAVARGLPVDYIERLKRIETRKARYPVPKEDGREGRLFSAGCHGCE